VKIRKEDATISRRRGRDGGPFLINRQTRISLEIIDRETRMMILQFLQFPRRLVQGQVDFDKCKHAGNYAEGDQGCEYCRYALECEWLYRNDECSALAVKSFEEVAAALEFTVAYIDAYLTRAGHSRRSCRCEICVWLKRARRLHASANTATTI
jgi:hypothetical protein